MGLPWSIKRVGIALFLLALAGSLCLAAYGWLSEHDARLRAETSTAEQQKQIGNLQQQQHNIELDLSRQITALEHEMKANVTAADLVASTSQMVPDLPKALQIEALPVNPSLPDGPKTEQIVVPQEDLAALRDAEIGCQEMSLKLGACTSSQAGLQQELKLTESQRDEWKTAAKGGTFWHRVGAAAKWFALGAGSGRQPMRLLTTADNFERRIMNNWERPFLRAMLSESDGTVSSARCCVMLVVLFSLGWVTGLVLHDKKLPDLGAVGSYSTLLCGSLYAINRGAGLLDRKSQNTNQPPQGGN